MIYDIPKPVLSASLQAATLLSRLPNGDFASRICVGAEKGVGYIRYVNNPYRFAVEFPLSAPVDDFRAVCSVATLQKLLPASSTAVSLRKSGSSYVVVVDGGASVVLDVIVGADADYESGVQLNTTRPVDVGEFRAFFTQLCPLLPAAVSVADKCVVCKSDYAYVNVGSILGRGRNAFGIDFSVSKYLLDALAPLLQFADAVECELDTYMGLRLSAESNVTVSFVFPVTFDPSILESFLSPLFFRVFESSSSGAFTLPVKQMLGHLKTISVLDYYADNAMVVVSPTAVNVQVDCTRGPAFNMSYNMTSGSGVGASVSVPIKVLTTLLDSIGDDAYFSPTLGGLLVLSGESQFCIRSVD